MRTALCLCGIVGGRTGKDGQGGPIDFQRCYDSYRQHIIVPNNADVFIHTWSVDFENDLRGLYQPKKALFQPQIQFKTHARLSAKEQHDEFIVQSKWYSTQEVMRLKREYEQENGFTYDFVMLSRFDLLWFVDFEFSKLKPGFYAANFNDLPLANSPYVLDNRSLKNKRLLDLWFLGTSEQMNKLASLYANMHVHIPKNIHKYSGASKLIDPHRYVWDHIDNVLGNPASIINFRFYRWNDFELIRIKGN